MSTGGPSLVLGMPSFGAASIVTVPDIGHLGLPFDAGLLLPFLIAALSMSLNSMGAITAAQASGPRAQGWRQLTAALDDQVTEALRCR